MSAVRNIEQTFASLLCDEGLRDCPVQMHGGGERAESLSKRSVLTSPLSSPGG